MSAGGRDRKHPIVWTKGEEEILVVCMVQKCPIMKLMGGEKEEIPAGCRG